MNKRDRGEYSPGRHDNEQAHRQEDRRRVLSSRVRGFTARLFVPASSQGGENYGWSLKEGKHPFSPGSLPTGLIDPIDEHSHDNGGIKVIGGYVYRGKAIDGLAGTYSYADSTGPITRFRYDQAFRVDVAAMTFTP